MDYDTIIERERRRRNLLIQKLDETDRRIQTLMAMSKQLDPLDRWLDEQMATPTPSTAPAPVPSTQHPAVAGGTESLQTAKMTRDTPRKISAQWVDLIEYLGLDGKDFSQVQSFMARGETPMTPGAIRTGLMNYRKDYGLVASLKPGFYCATQKGMEFVQVRRNRAVNG